MTWPGQLLAKGKGGLIMCSILLVDDSAVMRRLVRFHIEANSDWQVCGEAENGQIAVELVKKLRPQVVILDFQMPVMNGLEAARYIARLAPETAMVMLTMHNSEQLSRDAHAAGIKDVVSKSGSVANDLMASVANLVGK
jgi:two-component system, NarL family, response regulator YdfI